MVQHLRRPDDAAGEFGTKNMPRRVFLGLLGGAAALGVIAPGIQAKLAGSVVGGAVGLDGYQIYTVTGGIPTFDPATYRLRVDGMVRRPLSLGLHQLGALKPDTLHATFQCVTGWQVPNQVFEGVNLSRLLADASLLSGARYLNFYSFDGTYTESLPIRVALGPGAMVVTHLDGKPLSANHGAPVRLFVDHYYGYKSIKWLSRIEASSQPITGYWEHYGYPENAKIG